MTAGSEALPSANAKLRWAEDRHDEMQRIFQEFALPSDPNDRPVGIRVRRADRPGNLLVATFTIEAEMPEAMRLLAADVVHNTRVALDHVLARLKDQFGGDRDAGRSRSARPQMTGTTGSRMPAGRARSEGFNAPRPSS